MTHQDATQQDDRSQQAHQNVTHNLEHAEVETDQMAKHAVNAHPMAHEGHQHL